MTRARITFATLETTTSDFRRSSQRAIWRNRFGAADVPSANTGNLDFKQWGLLAIQDGGRRKPVDTFAKEALIRITGRSTYTDKTGRNMAAE